MLEQQQDSRLQRACLEKEHAFGMLRHSCHPAVSGILIHETEDEVGDSMNVPRMRLGTPNEIGAENHAK